MWDLFAFDLETRRFYSPVLHVINLSVLQDELWPGGYSKRKYMVAVVPEVVKIFCKNFGWAGLGNIFFLHIGVRKVGTGQEVLCSVAFSNPGVCQWGPEAVLSFYIEFRVPISCITLMAMSISSSLVESNADHHQERSRRSDWLSLRHW